MPHHGPKMKTARKVMTCLGNITSDAGVYESTTASTAHGLPLSVSAQARTRSPVRYSESGVKRQIAVSAMTRPTISPIVFHAGLPSRGREPKCTASLSPVHAGRPFEQGAFQG